MFLGTHAPRLDDKGRLFLPAKYRDEVAGGVVLTKGQERCIFVFTQAEFDVRAEQLRSAPLVAKRSRDYARQFFGGAYGETPDRQGRISVPPNLRTYAGLNRDCVLVGAGTRLEIWDAAAWATYEAEHEQAFADLEEEVPGVLA